MRSILGVCVAAALLAACGEIHYSDSEMSNIEVEDDVKGGRPDEPTIE